ncbi:MAG: PRC-barrel domain-containing protein [Candidatus Methanofastidiosia archaeon]
MILIKIKNLLGKKVFDIDAIGIGKVADAEFDEETFIINSIEVSKSLFKKVSINVEDVAKVGDGVFLKIKHVDIK